MDKCKTRLGYNAIPPLYTRNFMPPKPNLVYPSLDDFVDVNDSAVKKPTVQSNKPKTAKKENRAPIIKDLVSKINTVQPRTAVNNAGRYKNVINNAYPTTSRPINNRTASKNIKIKQKINTARAKLVNTARPKVILNVVQGNHGNPQRDLKDKGLIDSGCSRHMTGNRSYLIDYKEVDRGFVAFGGNSKGGKITRKGKIRTSKLDFEDVYFVKKLKFNLFSLSQMCDKKNSILFTDAACVVLSPDFKLPDESHVLLKVPRKDNMYSVDLKNVVPQGGKTRVETVLDTDYILLPLWTQDPLFSSSLNDSRGDGFKPSEEEEKKDGEDLWNKDKGNVVDENIVYGCADDLNMPDLEEIDIFSDAKNDDSGAAMNNLDTYFQVYQMDVKSAFHYGKIEEGVYVCQPTGFEDSDFPDRVYEVEKALYRLHQAPRAWYEALATYLLHNGFRRGMTDKILFIKRDKSDILLVQVYVDDIIFGSTRKKMCTEFEKMMHKKFHMSSIGELTFFLGLQVKQKKDGILY
nr:putative ribonuclease H-like domain-containing protein [Tanacetum cinerariifolium]